VVLDLVDHLGAEHDVHELRARDGQESSEECAGEEDGYGYGGVGQETAEDSGVGFGEEVPDAGEVEAVAGVDVIMGAADETVEVCFEGARAFVGAHGGEIGCGLAVEQAELAELGRGQGFEAGGFNLLKQDFEAAPAFFAQGDPVIGDHRKIMYESGNTESRGYADQLSIETPEQVDLRFPIAGIGSRFLALLTDSVIQAVALVVLILVFVLILSAVPKPLGLGPRISDTASKWFVAAMVLFYFLLYWGYFSLFEAFWNGQTPGKRLLKIRVIKDSGRQITLFEALARNLLRVVDALPSFYLIGVVTMLCNREQKRLGDLVAGTIVVHERSEEQPLMSHNSRTFTSALYPQPIETAREPVGAALPADAVAKLDAGDLNVIDTFFSRALDLDLDKRAEIAGRIAERMSAKMQVPLPGDVAPERVLESIAHAMRAHSAR
jgi:uncharacterized RDD family membrane protein YckC